ncbi:MAG: hypothetical protein AB7S26_19005 [Sandaracinaceae bacterium]
MIESHRMKVLIASIPLVVMTGCGASMRELSEHHVWERAICEATPEEQPAVQRGIEEDEQLAVAVQAVPRDVVAELAPSDPLPDRVIARVHRSANEVPLESSTLSAHLLVEGRPTSHEELTWDELLVRTGEIAPGARTVHHAGSGGGGSVGPFEFLGRLVLGAVTLGISELLISSARRGSGPYTEVVTPSDSELARAAPQAFALREASTELREGGDVYVWERPPLGTPRALELTVRYEGRGQRYETCAIEERLVIELDAGLPLEDAIERRFGHREHTLAELRRMAAQSESRASW